MNRYIIILLLFFAEDISSQIFHSINNTELKYSKRIEITSRDTMILSNNALGKWIKILPIRKAYDHSSMIPNKLHEIEYESFVLDSSQNIENLVLKNLQPHTFYITKLDTIESKFSSPYPIHLINESFIQIVVRENDDFIGSITEMLGTPFLLPTQNIYKYGHHTDLNIGADCAELAIYGRRRQGYKIPYCGPKGIIKYLKYTNKFGSGTIIHFGFQVSIVYKDNNIIGKFDPEDLLIHAFEDCVKIEKYKDSKLFGKSCRTYEWK